MKTPFTFNLQLFAEPAVNFEDILKKHAGEDGNIPADAISKAAQAISSAVGRAFVDKARYNAKLDEITQLEQEKNTAEDNATKAAKWEKKYNEEHDAFEKFKTDTEAKALESNKRQALRKIAKDAGLSADGIDKAVKYADLSKVELDADGNATNADKLMEGMKEEWKGFIVTTTTKGASVENPPANNGKAKRSKDEIMAIKDTSERQRAIAENHELFGF